MTTDLGRSEAEHAALIAFWAPLFHLLVYGLGWTRPDRGLDTWLARNAPIDDPILRLVDRWWGRKGVVDVLAWADSLGGLHAVLDPGVGLTFDSPGSRSSGDPEALAEHRAQPSWQQTWGTGSDPFHLLGHLSGPLAMPDSYDPTFIDLRQVDPGLVSQIPRALVISDTYAGWYTNFFHYEPALGVNGRSVRTDVFVKPIGWLGEFRQHAQTRLWFRGRASIHMWGQS